MFLCACVWRHTHAHTHTESARERVYVCVCARGRARASCPARPPAARPIPPPPHTHPTPLHQAMLRGDQPVFWPQRAYKWGTAEAFNSAHSDLLALRWVWARPGVCCPVGGRARRGGRACGRAGATARGTVLPGFVGRSGRRARAQSCPKHATATLRLAPPRAQGAAAVRGPGGDGCGQEAAIRGVEARRAQASGRGAAGAAQSGKPTAPRHTSAQPSAHACSETPATQLSADPLPPTPHSC